MTAAKAPLRPAPSRLLGHLNSMALQDSRPFYESGFHEVGADAYRMLAGPPKLGIWFHVFRSPQAMADGLGAGADVLTRDGNRFFEVFRELFGNGLFASEGEVWTQQRRALSPLFARGRIEDYTPLMQRHADAVASQMLDAPGPVDLAMVGRQISLGVVTEALFGAVPEALAERVGTAIAAASHYQMRHLRNPLNLDPGRLRALPMPFVRRGEAALAEIDAIIDEVLAAAGEGGSALIQQLRRAVDPETGRGFTDAEIRDQVLTFFLAGQETTSTVLTMALQLLGCHPDEQALVAEEVTSTGVPSTIDAAGKLERTTAVIDEAMRLYPPAYVTSRIAQEDIEVDGVVVPEGQVAMFAFAALHRHPDLWPDPAAFVPQRFVDLPALKHPRHTYLPFGAGRRACVGAQFAVLEAQVALAVILERMRVTTLTRDVRLRTDITLQAAEPVMALASAR